MVVMNNANEVFRVALGGINNSTKMKLDQKCFISLSRAMNYCLDIAQIKILSSVNVTKS